MNPFSFTSQYEPVTPSAEAETWLAVPEARMVEEGAAAAAVVVLAEAVARLQDPSAAQSGEARSVKEVAVVVPMARVARLQVPNSWKSDIGPPQWDPRCSKRTRT